MIRGLRFATKALALRPIAASRPVFAACRLYSSESAATSELVAALRSEVKIEKESVAETEEEDKEYFGSFLKDNGFSVVAAPGSEEVHLVRQVGDETVKVFFNISDTTNSQGLEEEFEGEEDAAEDLMPIRMNVVVERPKGAVGFEGLVQDNAIVVESVTPYDSVSLATEETAEADYKRRAVFQGPPFVVLDPSVQGAIQSFLESRKVDSQLAQFISEYSSYKENQVYIEYLDKIANILE